MIEPAPVSAYREIMADGSKDALRMAEIRLWVHSDIRCAIYWGGMSFNGYCQLPEGSVDRVIAEAYDAFERNDADRRDRRGFTLRGPIGYDILQDLDVHGGLTYGPDKEGWIGFDTGHAYDDWTDEVVEQVLRPASEEAWLYFREYQLILDGMWPPGRILKKHGGHTREWTLERLTAETDGLAEQIDQRHKSPVTNGAH